MNVQLSKIIDQYLVGELSAEDHQIFEQRLKENSELHQQVRLQKLVMETSKRSAQRNLIRKVGKKYHLRKKLFNGSLAIIILIAAAAGGLVLYSHQSKNDKDQQKSSEISESAKIQMDADLMFPNLAFDRKEINISDTVIFMIDGTLISIPENAYLLNGRTYRGKKIVQYQVAKSAQDIIKAGLSTTSNGKLLETGGMFSIESYTPEGKKLTIDPKIGVYVQFDVNGPSENMQLFNGQKEKDGTINWVNPQPIEKKPILISMDQLDFYPPGYESKLNELNWYRNKVKRDSLYLSFEQVGIPFGEDGSTKKLYYEIPIDKIAPKALFNRYCSVCHQIKANATGPPLFHIRKKWAEEGAKAGSIYQFVKNWKIAAANDPYVINVIRKKPVDMTVFPFLTDQQIDAIFDYIDTQDQESEGVEYPDHIPPSKVLAFWNSKFNNTILATHEFEERMKAIHGTCNEKVLDVYLQNLQLPLWQSDQKVLKMGYSQFQQFADEKVGKIDLTDEHQANLKKFFDAKMNEMKQRALSEKDFAQKLKQAYNKRLSDMHNSHSLSDFQRNAQNYSEEWEINYVDCLRQLGKQREKVGVVITGAPVYNLDRFVSDRTSTRTSGKFYDKTTGKTAEINYDPFTLSISDYPKFNQIFVYLLSEKLHSFERIPIINGKANYNLNRLMSYRCVIVGINKDGYFAENIGSILPKEYSLESLKPISERKLDQLLNSLDQHRVKTPAYGKTELDWLKSEQKDIGVQIERKKQQAFRDVLYPIIYPCLHGYEFEADSTESISM